jgi:YidC/Oxa1 family membrane protein insertase
VEKRIALLTVLSLGVLIGWMFLSNRLWPPPKPKPKPVVYDEPAWTEVRKAAVAPPPVVEASQEPRESIVLEGKTVRATLTNRGAGLRLLELKFRDQWMPLLSTDASGDAAEPHLVLSVTGEADVDSAFWRVKEETPTRVAFARRLQSGLELERVYAVDDRGALAMKILITNSAGGEQKLQAELRAFRGMEHDSTYRRDQYARGFAVKKRGQGYELVSTPLANLEKKPARHDGTGLEKGQVYDTVGLANRFFAVALLAESDSTREALDAAVFAGHGKAPTAHVDATLAWREISVRDKQQLEYTLFAGPLDDHVLAEAGRGLPDLHQYGGCFWPISSIVPAIAQVLLWLMGFWAWLTGNWGVAIILTTLCLRLCLFPLSKKSAVSMAKMGELGPKMTLIRERYSDDPRKAQAETMKLWKEHGVSPLSGCLPIFLQLPIWISMYSVVDMAIEFRQAPFMLWIKDLSQPDQLAHLPFTLPLIGSDFNLLPLIMTVTWFLQAYYAPRSPDPQMAMQQKMFLFMPIVFGLMCYSLASALSLYFFMNSLLSMAEQKIIKRVWLPPKAPDAPGGKPA